MSFNKNARVEDLVSKLISSNLNLSGVSSEFLNFHSKIGKAIAKSKADGTLNQYYLAFNRFSNFCVENNVLALPSHPEVIMTYFLKISENAQTASSVLMARSAIRFFNLLYNSNLPCPTDRIDVSLLVNSIERRLAHPVKKRAVMTMEILKRMIDFYLQGDQLRSNNFKASLEDWQLVTKSVFKFHTFARFEEAIELKKSDFEFLDNGDCEVMISKSKNNQFQDANKVTIAKCDTKYCPVKILKFYFALIDSPLDHFFIPKIVRNQVYLLEKAEYRTCLDKFKLGIKKLGIQNWQDFGEHSDRAGGLSAAANAGCSLADLQFQGRWRSDNVPKIYHKRSKQCKRLVSSVLNKL